MSFFNLSNIMNNSVNYTPQENINFIDYDNIMNEYLNNISIMRQSLTNIIDTHNLFLTHTQTMATALSMQNDRLFEIIMTNNQLSNIRVDNVTSGIDTAMNNIINNINNRNINSSVFTRLSQRRNNTTGFRYIPLRTIALSADVVITPTPEQIESSTVRILFKDINNNERFYDLCPISYLIFEEETELIKINSCGHYFEPNALLGWFRNSVVCPVCRYDIRDGDGGDGGNGGDGGDGENGENGGDGRNETSE